MMSEMNDGEYQQLRHNLIVICSSACRIKSAELLGARVVVSLPDHIDASIPRMAMTIVTHIKLI